MDSKTFIDSLTGKVGPLPGYAWVAIGAGGIYWYRKKHPSTATVVPSTSPADTSSSSSAPVAPVGTMSTDQAANQLYQSSPYTLDQIQQAIANAAQGASPSGVEQQILDQVTQLQQGQQSIAQQIQNSPTYQPLISPAPVVNPVITPNNPNVPPNPIENNPPAPAATSAPVSPYSNGSTARSGGLAGTGSARGD